MTVKELIKRLSQLPADCQEQKVTAEVEGVGSEITWLEVYSDPPEVRLTD